MDRSDTVVKRAVRSQKIEEPTVKPYEPKYKSQIIHECVSLQTKG
jgi:hypothetical protein